MSFCLVTGASGFVGSNLVGHLQGLGWRVRCLVRKNPPAELLETLGAELVHGQLSDQASIERAVREVDVVFHVAGRVRALRRNQFEQDNVQGTRHVAEACAAQAKPPVLVLVSSLAAGGPATLAAPRRETDRDQPISIYGRSKLDGERAAAALAGDVPLSIVRPPIIFGPADRASLPVFLSARRIHLHPVPGFRRFEVSIVHIADLCDAMVRIAQHGTRVEPSRNGSTNLSDAIYHVASERTITYGEFGQLAANSIACKVHVLPLPKAMFWLIGGAMETVGQALGRPSVLGWDKVREAVASGWVCDDKKIRTQLGYQPAATLEQRFAETAAWYRKHEWL